MMKRRDEYPISQGNHLETTTSNMFMFVEPNDAAVFTVYASDGKVCSTPPYVPGDGKTKAIINRSLGEPL